MKSRLISFAARWFLGGIFRDIAEGKGKYARLTPLYWKLAGVKTRTAAVVGLLFAALAAFNHQLFAQYQKPILGVLAFLVTVGLVDADWRTERLPPSWLEAFAKLMQAGPAISGAVALLVEYLPQIPGCESCAGLASRIQTGAAAVAAVSAWIAARYYVVPPTNPLALPAANTGTSVNG